jgi:hypothetical protein
MKRQYRIRRRQVKFESLEAFGKKILGKGELARFLRVGWGGFGVRALIGLVNYSYLFGVFNCFTVTY